MIISEGMTYRTLSTPEAKPQQALVEETFSFFDQLRCKIGKHRPSGCHFLVVKKVALYNPSGFEHRRIILYQPNEIFCRCCRLLLTRQEFGEVATLELERLSAAPFEGWERHSITEFDQRELYGVKEVSFPPVTIPRHR